MARPARKSADPTRPLLKPAVRVGNLDTAALIGELRQVHEDAEDENIGRMPADEELFRALLYLEANAGAVKSEEARRKAAITRVKLWQYLREQAEIHQAKAVEDARAANAEWADLVPALAVNAPSAAYNKAKRLQAALLADPSRGEKSVRRTPEAVLEAQQRLAAQAAALRRAEVKAASHQALTASVAQRLLEHRADLESHGDVIFWLDQIEAVLPNCDTPTQMLSLKTYVEAVVRELKKIERTTTRPPVLGPAAQLAYAAAAEIISR
ncbi:hypothetical protein AB0919_39710 [Streptomyces sp. NPDC046994]|uniref:hypothetical protein n=1 Tax=Streptomyces sp. NPDC046994 TaxID=3155735 RepID=UPI0034543775